MPAPASMRIDVFGDTVGVHKMLDHLDTATNPVALASFMGAVVDPYVQERAEARFRNEGDDVVGQWAQLKPATRMFRQAAGFSPDHPINVRTGELENYVTSRGNVTNFGAGAQLEAPGVTATGDLRDKITQAQIGSPRGVARPVIGLNWNDMTFLLGALANLIKGKP